MPTYTYQCASCETRFDQVQKFSDDALTVCPTCAGTLRRVFHPVGVVFKGSGWYINDSRNSSKSTMPSTEGASSTPADAKPSESTTDSPPAAAATATATATEAKPAATKAAD